MHSKGITITILGCGSSAGVPLIGCDCAVCRSDNPYNKRLRTSIMIETQGKRLLVDTSPDLRQQALRAGFKTIDAVLYTHAHADHTHGIDDVRSFNFHGNKAIPIYGDQATIEELQQRFDYAFLPPSPHGWFRACLTAHQIVPFMPFDVEGITVTPFPQEHGRVNSMGFRIGDMAYSTDVKVISDAAFDVLRGVKTWVVDCLGLRDVPTHADLELTLEWIRRVKPERAILVHMGHELEYEALVQQLPSGVEPGFDGMVIRL